METIINKSCLGHYPDTHEPVFQDNPGEQEDKGFVTTEQGRDVCGGQLLQSQQVQVVSQSPQNRKGGGSFKKELQRQTILTKDPTTFPRKIKRFLIKGIQVSSQFCTFTAA